MKFFTLAWWAGEIDDRQAALVAYRRYLDSIEASLPAHLRRLLAEVSLHDAHLRRLHLADGALELHLDACGFDATTQVYFRRVLQLTYRGVRALTSSANPEAGLAGPHDYGDLGYDEVEVVDANLYEHRMLFSTGIELHVRFAEFFLRYDDEAT